MRKAYYYNRVLNVDTCEVVQRGCHILSLELFSRGIHFQSAMYGRLNTYVTVLEITPYNFQPEYKEEEDRGVYAIPVTKAHSKAASMHRENSMIETRSEPLTVKPYCVGDWH